MEGRKGEKTRKVAVYDLEQRPLIDAEITRRTVDFMKRSVGREEALLRLRAAHPGAPADHAASRFQGQDRQRRFPGLARRDRSSPRPDPRCHRSARDRGQHHRRLHQRQRPRPDVALARLVGALARLLLHAHGGLAARALHHPLAGQGPGGRRQQRDRAPGRHLHDLPQDRRRRGPLRPRHRRRRPDRISFSVARRRRSARMCWCSWPTASRA